MTNRGVATRPAQKGCVDMNDMLHYAMEKAVEIFGNEGDGVFTSACLSEAITKLAGINGVIHGHIIRCLMVGRTDVEVLSDAHFRLMPL